MLPSDIPILMWNGYIQKKDKKENIYSTILVNKEKFSLNNCIENN